jgi:hypothetical protein
MFNVRASTCNFPFNFHKTEAGEADVFPVVGNSFHFGGESSLELVLVALQTKLTKILWLVRALLSHNDDVIQTLKMVHL